MTEDIAVLLLASGEKLSVLSPIKDDASCGFFIAGPYSVEVSSLYTCFVGGFQIAILFKSCKVSHRWMSLLGAGC